MSLNLYTYCANNPILYIDPSGNTPKKLIDLVNAQNGSVTYDDNTQTATVNINGTYHSYTNGKFGNYIDATESRMYVEMELFDRDFGLNEVSDSSASLDYYSKAARVDNGVGYSVYSGRTINRTGDFVSARSYSVYTFEYSVEGQKIAQAINDDANKQMGRLKIAANGGLTYFTSGVNKIISAIIAVYGVADSIYDNEFSDYSLGLEAGDTLIISNYSASMFGSMSRVGVTTTYNVYNNDGNYKCSGKSSKGH